MRLKPYFTITLSLTAMLLVGCSQQDTSLNGPEIASVSLAKGGTKGPPVGGGAELATFAVTFSGEVTGSHEWTRKLREGGNMISTPFDQPITLDMSFFQDPVLGLGGCFNAEAGTYAGGLLIGEGKKNEPGPAKAWFWFNAKGTDGTTDIVYMLRMYGTIEDPENWPPASGTTNTLTLGIWEMHIEGNKFKDVACTGSTGEEGFSTTVLVERVGALAG